MSQRLSLPFGILATMNVMFGTGVLINTTNLIALAGFYSFLPYVIVAFLLIPLLYVFSTLLTMYPEGGLYAFSKDTLGPTYAFTSTWAYLTGKLASATLLIHVFSLFLQRTISSININPFYIDALILGLFMWLNFYGMKTGKWLTLFFMMLKIIPVFSVIMAGLYFFNEWNIPFKDIPLETIPEAIPLVLYAFFGFEVACSLSLALKNPERNASRVLIWSFIATVCLTITYQAIAFLALGDQAYHAKNFIDAFSLIIQRFPLSFVIQRLVLVVIYFASGFAALGGAYGILMSNNWNIYMLAQHNHLPYSALLRKKNSHAIPFAGIIFQGIICIFYFLLTHAQQIPLQQISVLGGSIGFSISCISYCKQFLNKHKMPSVIAILAAISSCLLILNCLISILYYQSWYPGIYIILLIAGLYPISKTKI